MIDKSSRHVYDCASLGMEYLIFLYHDEFSYFAIFLLIVSRLILAAFALALTALVNINCPYLIYNKQEWNDTWSVVSARANTAFRIQDVLYLLIFQGVNEDEILNYKFFCQFLAQTLFIYLFIYLLILKIKIIFN